jgi:hypothetical protein
MDTAVELQTPEYAASFVFTDPKVITYPRRSRGRPRQRQG